MKEFCIHESVMSCETVPPLGTSDHNGDVSLCTPLAAPQVSRESLEIQICRPSTCSRNAHTD